MTPPTLVTLGLILLIPVLVTAGPIFASALIARSQGAAWSGGMIFWVVGVLVGVSVTASAWAFRLAWRRGCAPAHDPSGSSIAR